MTRTRSGAAMPAPDGLGRDSPADGQEDVGTPPEVTLDADVGARRARDWNSWNGKAVERVHDARCPGPFGRQPAERAGLRAVRVHDVVARLGQVARSAGAGTGGPAGGEIGETRSGRLPTRRPASAAPASSWSPLPSASAPPSVSPAMIVTS